MKQETDQRHRALEARLEPQLARLSSVDAYAQLLRTFYGFYAPLETAIESVLPGNLLPDLAGRRKAALLLGDLQAIGQPAEHIPLCAPPPLESPAAAFGALYVLEGSTLGGRFIVRMISTALPDLPESALTFFRGYGPDTGPMWLRFQAALSNWGTQNDPAPAVDAANRTFETFDAWIQQNQPR
ncbi:biliverdin-producing heme oxygenase [Flaviaesturariibacter amylovorans]|uniref:Biliverdin-producing heme oxygenase n=1 Tax=Flaviaesturariibacter amylovorans TaxID=1084520 RepID=A0ABP8H0W5_9BACT